MAFTQTEATLSRDAEGRLIATIEASTFEVGWVVTEPDGTVVQCGPKIELEMVSQFGDPVEGTDGGD
jgi:hypothetical protein